MYTLHSATLIYGYVVGHRPDGSRPGLWDALVTGTDGADDALIRERVPLDAAKQGVERHAGNQW